MSIRRSTVTIRVKKGLANELKTKFPNNSMSELLQIAYDTSLLKLESKLRVEQRQRKKNISKMIK